MSRSSSRPSLSSKSLRQSHPRRFVGRTGNQEEGKIGSIFRICEPSFHYVQT